MQTRQELILDFMKAMAGSQLTAEVAKNEMTGDQERYARDIYLMAAIFADTYIARI